MQRNFWILLIAVVAGMIGLFALTGDSKTESAYATYNPEQVQLTDYIYGLDEIPATQEELDAIMATKPAVLIEYADFECAACAVFFPVVAQLKLDYYEKDFVFVYRHFPLTSIHQDAMAAHRASVAAAKQDAFWAMHDTLYQRQNQWIGTSNSTKTFEGYATELGLNSDQYLLDVASQDTFDRINVDVESARPWNVNSTPSVFFNNERVETPTYENLTNLINSALNTEAS